MSFVRRVELGKVLLETDTRIGNIGTVAISARVRDGKYVSINDVHNVMYDSRLISTEF